MFWLLSRSWMTGAVIAGALTMGTGGSAATAGLVPAQASANRSAERAPSPTFTPAAVGVVHPYFNTERRLLDVAHPEDVEPGIDNPFTFRTKAQTGRVFPRLAENSHAAATGDDGISTYLACWEGKLARRSGGDPRELTIEIATSFPSMSPSSPSPVTTSTVGSAGRSATSSSDEAAITEPLLIPLPPALWSGLGGLVGLGVIGAYKRTTRRSKW